ncbi:ABC transporter permease [Candidatus Bathyarchaeota archaeon]|nr:ABC transporter permease [Candidatus Bathyarchaeota archaeon]
MGLKTYIARRIVYMFILVFFVLTLNFVIFMLMPGDPTAMFANSAYLTDPEIVKTVRERFGLDENLFVRYIKYIRNMLTGEFGYSFYNGKPVISEFSSRLMNTLYLVGLSTVLSIIIGIILGVIAASRRGSRLDDFLVTSSLIGYSLPSFWIGMVMLLIFHNILGWFPGGGTMPPEWAFNPPDNILVEIGGRLYHLALPVATLVIFQYGGYLLLTRTVMLETITEDYILTAKAKGLRERTILFKHALKNASLPLITNIAISFGFMLSGAIITEQVFTYPGLGEWLWKAIGFADYPVLQAMFYVIALCVIVANFLADLIYGVIDPRIRYG